jgi:mRNA interferase HigB
MHVISQKTLRVFWAKHPAAKNPLQAWFTRTRRAEWDSFEDVKADFGSADQVGRLTVFDIGGNKYRLIAHIHFNRGKVYVRQVLTHANYDKGAWKKDL